MGEKFTPPWPTGDTQNKEFVKIEEPVIPQADKDVIAAWPTPAEGIRQIRTLAVGNAILERAKAEHKTTSNTWYACLRANIAILSTNIELDEEVSQALGKERSQEILAELATIGADLEKLREQYPTREKDVPEDKFEIVEEFVNRIKAVYEKAAE